MNQDIEKRAMADAEKIIQETIDGWSKPLPTSIKDELTGEMVAISPEEIFSLEDYDIKKILEAEGVESRWKDYVLSRGTNNFWNLFSSDKPSMDRIPLYWVKPFYINSRFNGAWSQMCEKFPNEIRIIITEARMPGSVPKNERDEILKKLALFLNEKGVLVTYLCR